MGQDERRRDLLFRAVVDHCQRALDPTGYVLVDRGTTDQLDWVRFDRRFEHADAPDAPRALRLTHHPGWRWLQANAERAGQPGPPPDPVLRASP